MYLFNIIKDIYEVSPVNSTDFILSQYILTHIKDIKKTSLTDISIQTNISKSTVSKYFKSVTNGHNFALFKTSLSFELQNIIIDDNIIEQNALELINKFQLLYQNTLQLDTKQLAKIILEAPKIMIWGDYAKKSYFNNFINYLLFHQKNIRFISNFHFQDHYNEIKELTYKDLIIIIEPHTSLYDFIIRTTISAEVFINKDNIKCQKYFIGKPSYPDYQFSTITIENTNNVFINDFFIEYFATLLLYDYLQLNKKETQ